MASFESFRESVKGYLLEGKKPGGFLSGAICMDYRAILRADIGTYMIMKEVYHLIDTCIPQCAIGQENFNKWITDPDYRVENQKFVDHRLAGKINVNNVKLEDFR